MKLHEIINESASQDWKAIWDSGEGMFVREEDDGEIWYVEDGKRGSGSAWDSKPKLWDHIDELLKSSSFDEKERAAVESAIDNQDSPGHLDEVEWDDVEEYLNDDLEIEEMSMDDLAQGEVNWGEEHYDEEEDEDDDEEEEDDD